MRGVIGSTRLILTGFVLAAMAPGAHAREQPDCLTTRTNDQDRAGFLEIARTLVRPWRLTPETFSYCTREGMFSDTDGATVETVRLKQRDGTRKYFVVSCKRKHLKPPWSCSSIEQRSLQVVIYEPDGEKAHEAQLTLDIDAEVARSLLISSFKIARESPQDIPVCGVHPVAWTGAIPRRLAASWHESNYLKVSSWSNRYSVTRGWTTLEYSKADRPGSQPVFRCWGEEIIEE
jgi:hypothetical protein